jgi:hypothetical protein
MKVFSNMFVSSLKSCKPKVSKSQTAEYWGYLKTISMMNKRNGAGAGAALRYGSGSPTINRLLCGSGPVTQFEKAS